MEWLVFNDVAALETKLRYLLSTMGSVFITIAAFVDISETSESTLKPSLLINSLVAFGAGQIVVARVLSVLNGTVKDGTERNYWIDILVTFGFLLMMMACLLHSSNATDFIIMRISYLGSACFLGATLVLFAKCYYINN